jgi:hypothetical protein
MAVCVLTKREVGRLTNYGIVPSHHEHTHISFKESLVLLADDTMRVVDGPHEYITEQDSNNRKWRSRPSDGMQVLQLVPTT